MFDVDATVDADAQVLATVEVDAPELATVEVDALASSLGFTSFLLPGILLFILTIILPRFSLHLVNLNDPK